MMRFYLDIEKYYNELAARGEQLKGIFSLQYPIYCIHSSIIDTTPDPLGNLDAIIAEFINSIPNLSPFQIASIVGSSKMLIELRLNKMLADSLIEKSDEGYTLTPMGIEVFIHNSQIRRNKVSYDFYLDGITLQPLPKMFYTIYRSKFIRETDSYYHTNLRGYTYLVRPFGPDIVHSPLNKNIVVNNIISISAEGRGDFSIPEGLIEITELSFTKLSLQLPISVSAKDGVIKKEVIDGFAVHSLATGLSYYETVKENVKIFEPNLNDKIQNLEFKIQASPSNPDTKSYSKPNLVSNWPEIDNYKDSQKKCFSFSSVDLVEVLISLFELGPITADKITNSETLIKIEIGKETLLGSSNREKVVEALLRGRDYRFGHSEQNVFICFFEFFTSDEFVLEVMELKKAINIQGRDKTTGQWMIGKQAEMKSNYRQLLIAAGEMEILESIDVEEHM